MEEKGGWIKNDTTKKVDKYRLKESVKEKRNGIGRGEMD